MEQRKMGYSKRIYEEVGKLIKRSVIQMGAVLVIGLCCIPMLREYYEAGYEWFVYLLGIGLVVSLVLDFRNLTKFSNVLTNISKNELEFNDTGVRGVYTDDPKIASNEKYINIEYSQIDRAEVKEPNVGDIKLMGVYHNLYVYCDHGLVKFCVDDAHAACKYIEEGKK